MADYGVSEGSSFVELSLAKATQIEKAMIHLAKAIELDLVDVALDPSSASNGSRERYAALGSKLAELSGISYELMTDISSATGIEIVSPEAPSLEQANHSKLADSSESPLLSPVVDRTKAPSPAPTVRPTAQPVETPEPTESRPVAPVVPQTETTAAPPETTSSNELFDRIIDLERMPEMRSVEDVDAIRITVGNDNTVSIKGRDLKLSTNEVFLFNALLLLRDKPRSSSELRELGFEPAGKSPSTATFGNAMKSLIEKLNRAAGKEIIKPLGENRGRKYAFNPRAVLSDLRGTDQEFAPSNVAKKN